MARTRGLEQLWSVIFRGGAVVSMLGLEAVGCSRISDACQQTRTCAGTEQTDAGDAAMLGSGGGSSGGADAGSVGGANPGGGADSGGGGAPDGSAGGGSGPITVTVDFPLPGLSTASVVHARGTVSETGASDALSVTIGGATATVSGTTWTAAVTLTDGDNTLTATATDAHGVKSDSPSVTVKRVGPSFEEPTAFAYDAAGQRFFVLDSVAGLLSVDIATSMTTLVTGPARGTGPALTKATSIAFDSARNAILVPQASSSSLVSVSLDTGDRTVVADKTTAVLPVGSVALQTPTAVAVDQNRAFVTDTGADTLYAVDLTKGSVTAVSDASDGPSIQYSSDVAYDAADQLLFALDRSNRVLLQIRISDGVRSVVTVPGDGRGFDATSVAAIAFDDQRHRIVLLGSGEIFDIDPSTSQPTLLAIGDPNVVGTYGTSGLAVDTATSELLSLGDRGLVRYSLTIDPSLHVISSPTVGTGPFLGSYQSVAYGEPGLLTLGSNSILVADPKTGNRTELSSSTVGTGPQFTGLVYSIQYDWYNHRILALEDGSLLSVDPTTGNRTVVSSSNAPTVGTGPALSGTSIADFVENGRALVANGADVVAVNLTNGNRTVLSGASRGTGPVPAHFIDLTYDSAGVRYVATTDADQILAIDPITGNRTVVSASGVTPALKVPESLFYDQDDGSVLVVDDRTILKIDLATGKRRVLQTLATAPADLVFDFSDASVLVAGNGQLATLDLVARKVETLTTPAARGDYSAPDITTVNGIARGGWLAIHGVARGWARAFGSDSAIMTFDLSDGTSTTVGGAAALPLVLYLVVDDEASGRLYGGTVPYFGVAGSAPRLFYRDLSTGAQTELSDGTLGTGPSLGSPFAAALDSTNHRLIVTDTLLPGIVAVDNETGARAIVSGPGDSGVTWKSPSFLSLDAALQRAYVVDGTDIFTVDLSNGSRTQLTGDASDAGAPLGNPQGMVLDAARHRLIVRDMQQGAFIEVDLGTGALRTITSDPNAGALPRGGSFLSDIDYDSARRILYTGDTVHPGRGVAAVDEVTGDWIAVLGRPL